MDAWKCFLAVRSPPHPALTSLLQDLSQCGRGVRAVNPADLHVTLKFLGPTPVEQVGAIVAAVRARLVAARPSVSRLIGLGAFPNSSRPSVLWTGVSPAEALSDLAERCESACGPLGFPRESRPFLAHLTLARITGRAPDGVRALLADAAERDWGELPIDSVELLRSESGRGNGRYTTLARIPLA